MPWLLALARLPRGLSHLAAALRVSRELAHVDESGRQERIRWFAGTMLQRLGLRLHASGTFAPGPVLIVANHVSWLDILAIHAVCPAARFVSKADVHRWPVLGGLVASAGTLFIERHRRRDSMRVVHEMAAALKAGQSVAVFPEGTTSAGHTLLPFHAGLLQAAISTGTPVQPVVLRYLEEGRSPSRAASFEDVNLVQSIWRVLCARGLEVELQVLPPLDGSGDERRALAETLRARMLAAHHGEAQPSGPQEPIAEEQSEPA